MATTPDIRFSVIIRYSSLVGILLCVLTTFLGAGPLTVDAQRENETIAFDGRSYVLMDLRKRPIASFRETIRFSLKTNDANGNILYSKGTQGDVMALQMVNNKLLFSLDLGGDGLLQSVSSGSLLDDNVWHEINITRNGFNVYFTVDEVMVKGHLKGDYMQLNLNHQLFFGGIPVDSQFDNIGTTRENYTGCIQNLLINSTDVIREIKDDRKQYLYQHIGMASYYCADEPVSPVTFFSSESHLTIDGYMVPYMNCSFHFRTFNPDGLLLYHKFSTEGYVKLYLTAGLIEVQVQGTETPVVILKPFDKFLNDGLWHPVILLMQENLITLYVDGKPSLTRRRFSMTTGHHYLIGGGPPGHVGFVGCMRWIFIEGRYIKIESLPDDRIHRIRKSDVQFEVCAMTDRCHPNPCEHGGVCRQSNTEFSCDCSLTGYHGAVCHVSRHPISCEAFHLDHPRARHEQIEVDVDGSGPLEPFPVTCLLISGGRSQTILRHQTESDIEVRGFQMPGSYVQDIEYQAPWEAISEMVNRSYSCKQFLSYHCQGARLLNSPSAITTPFEPFSYWISRNNQKMDYWGGSLPGSRKCSCGLYGNCRNPNKWCNCDSSSEVFSQNSWLMDAGDLTQKEYLPIRQIRIGDTGNSPDSRQGVRYQVGSLICEGNVIIDNTVTFRYEDATINIPSYQFGLAADVYLQFKTTTEFGTLFHSKGPEDFIQLRIVTGKTMQFEYSTGKGTQSITVESPVRLNDNKWHSVLVERTPIEARLLVDGKLSAEQRSRAGQVKPLNLTSDFVIGATVDHREGYVGCVRSFLIDGEFVDLVRHARRGTYGVNEGCSGKCESSPCLNEGTCLEGYSDYSCDCQWTAFKGPICADEIGVNLRSDNYIRYDFETTISTLEETIRVGFTTTEHRGLIVGINSQNDEYMNLLMSTSGHLRLVFDFGFERQEIIIKNENFALGQHHDLTIKRSDKGSKITIWVDNYEPIVYTYKISPKADAQFNQLKSIYVGRNETMPSGDGFVGCISRVSFDDHFPLRRMFQENRRANVHAFPSIEALREDSCGIEPVTHPTEMPEIRPPPTLAPGITVHDMRSSTLTTATLIGIVAAILLAIVIVLLFFSYRYASTDKGEYMTHEDIGARQAADPDTAVVKGKTGHEVAKVKEYFI